MKDPFAAAALHRASFHPAPASLCPEEHARCFHMARAQQAQPWCNEPQLNTISDADSVIAAQEMEQNGG